MFCLLTREFKNTKAVAFSNQYCSIRSLTKPLTKNNLQIMFFCYIFSLVIQILKTRLINALKTTSYYPQIVLLTNETIIIDTDS